MSAGPPPVAEGETAPESPEPDAPPRRELPGPFPPRPEGQRLHPVTPWRRAWAPIAGLAAVTVQDIERTRQWAEHLTLGRLGAAFAVLVPVAVVYGFLTWWYTSYLVTDTELRIRTGLLFRRSAHIRLDRIQAVDVSRPLLARVAQVAKLKLDVVGADAKDELAFLSEQDAVALRAELLARAAGMAPEAAPRAGEAPSRALLGVRTRMLITSVLLLAGGWLALAALLVVPPLIWLAVDSPWPAVAVAFPLVGAVWGNTGGRVVREFGWTVAESPDGVRLDRGLLDREHETVPPGRVQYLRIVEPLLWRRLGWVRVELEVAGAGGGRGRGRDRGGVLIPVTTREEAARVLARTLPGFDLAEAADALTGAPARARWCAPWRWRAYAHGVTDTVFVTRRGLLRRRTELVPHAKVQSVRFRQGPWKRRMGLADLSVDHGANGWATARLRDAVEARALLAAQADRSRTGRRTARPDRWLT
ncbi:PH domain-containing protein [Streptomyces sp. TR06-5]|uniref:PH domain-containing protein n=1 Tax=unclassified Streptomyces TaxID=2593676 RepID=UPI0039A303A5